MQNVDNAKLSRLLSLGIGLLVVICLGLILLGRIGSAKVNISLPQDSSLTINGKKVTTEGTIKLHPGTYSMMLKSSTYSLLPVQLTVSSFQTKQIDESSFTKRSPDVILGSVIGSYGAYGPPTLSDVRWFDGEQWLVGSVGPGSASAIALQYAQNNWKVAYFNQPSYDRDYSQLPAEVQQYLQSLEKQHVQ